MHHREEAVRTARSFIVADVPATMSPKEIIHLRKKVLDVSQILFAKLFNVALQTVHAWEQGRRKPRGASLRLLKLTQSNPEPMRKLIGTRSDAAGGN